MNDSVTIYFFDKSYIEYDANKNIFCFIGVFAHRVLKYYDKHRIIDTEERFRALQELKAQFESKFNINIINTTLKNISALACSFCNDSGIISDGYENYYCRHCELNRIIDDLIN